MRNVFSASLYRALIMIRQKNSTYVEKCDPCLTTVDYQALIINQLMEYYSKGSARCGAGQYETESPVFPLGPASFERRWHGESIKSFITGCKWTDVGKWRILTTSLFEKTIHMSLVT